MRRRGLLGMPWDLAGIKADPKRKPYVVSPLELLVFLIDRLKHREAREHGSDSGRFFGVTLEDRADGIADVLLDPSAEAMDLPRESPKIRAEDLA